ncbi:ligand-binding sensor domain-containing protein [Salmonirosea aquatica]|uniref:Histidine kinase n=1 Tax=Salmonirosea aquatica TaxID=2654236 RepID=A0A7C9BUI4_9BACT|nr:hypothetical protein [Cytophagaceae bacterium SJW1-29]
MKTRVFFTLLVLCGQAVSWPFISLAQPPVPAPSLWFQHLTLRQGLAANFTTSITQDNLGFIWIGTVNGLTRFDGRNCRTFTRQSGDSASLSHRVIRSVFTSKKGTLWVGAEQGLNRYDPINQKFRRYSFEGFGVGSNFIRNITENHDGILWCGTKAGLLRFDPVAGKARLLRIPADSVSQAGANAIRALVLEGTTLWLGTQAGLYAYDLQKKRVKAYRSNPESPTSLPGDYVAALARYSPTGELVVGTGNGFVALLDSGKGTFRKLPLSAGNQAVASLLCARDGDLWVGLGSGGLHKFNPGSNTFTSYLSDELNPRSMGCNCVRGLFEDRNGIVWIVTDDAGVNWFNPSTEKFHLVYDEIGYHPATSLGLDAIKLSVDRQNNLWVATHGGLLRVDPQKPGYLLYSHDPRNPNSLGTDFLYAVLADHKGRIWAGGSGLTRFDPQGTLFEQILCLNTPTEARSARRDFVAGDQIYSILENRDGRIFMGTNEKLTIYDPQTDTYLTQYSDERIRKLPGKNYNTMYLDRHDNLWIGGFGPVYKISPELRVLAQYNRAENDPHSLPDEGVTGFAEDTKGYMWIATDNGLARLNVQTGRFKTFTTQDGLPTNDISALLVTGDTLWASTSKGIVCIDTRKMRLTVFDEDDGLPASEFESDAVARDSTGRIYFGAVHGLASIHPKSMRLNRSIPPVFLTSFRVEEHEFLRGQVANPAPLVLNYRQNSFTFDMASLNFDNPADNQFAYRLEGFEERWHQAGTNSSASYTNIPPGDYVLHSIASNNDGVWNRQGYRLPVHITPPFWQRWWFRLAVLAALIASTVVTARWREQRLVREQQEKSALRERIAASEMKALRSQMNPHFLYNSLNAIRLFVLQNDSDNADRYLVKFSRLMRLILENSGQEWVTLADELDQLQLYLELEQLRFDHTFDFSIDTDSSVAQEKISVPPMIIQPYIENAILHGIAHKTGRGKIQVQIRSSGERLVCRIEDNGVGRQKAGELKSKTISSHKSMGLQVTQERLQLISQRYGTENGIIITDLFDQDHQPSGTSVVIQLPILPA